MIYQLEQLMLQVSEYFLAPVLLLLAGLFLYSLFAAGQFVCQALVRRANSKAYTLATQTTLGSPVVNVQQLSGYPLTALAHRRLAKTQDELDVAALKELETVRLVCRLAPMLGLIATMVPMGPALKSLANGNVQGISANLSVAFAAVIFGLVIASITFWIASIKKRWLACELVALTPLLQTPRAVEPSHAPVE